jgi:hypothetical protein
MMCIAAGDEPQPYDGVKINLISYSSFPGWKMSLVGIEATT